MAQSSALHNNGQRIILANAVVITTAVTAVVTTPVQNLIGINYLTVQANLTYGSGGTTAKFWVQTSYDAGVTWVDIMSFAFTTASLRKVSAVNTRIAPAAQAATATDGTLADNTIIQGTLGNWLRLKYTTTGTYADSTTISINAIARG